MAELLKVGVLGAGNAGSSHAAAYSRLPDVEVAGLWSRTRTRAEELAGKLDESGLKVYDDWQEMIEQGGLDAVSIAVPAVLRSEPIAAALEHGLHVLTEKPFTVHLAEARELTRLAEQAKTITAISFNWRYTPGSQVTRRAVQEGEIGQVLHISMQWRFRLTVDPQVAFSPTSHVWHADMGGGFVREAGSHEFDRARFEAGLEFTKVVGRLPAMPYPGTDADESYLLIAELSSGGLGNFLGRFTSGQGERRSVLYGDECTLISTLETVVRQRRDDDEPVSLDIPEEDRCPDDITLMQHTWNRLIADFVSAIRQGDLVHESVPHLPSFGDGLHVQELIAAAECAEAERRWVSLDEL